MFALSAVTILAAVSVTLAQLGPEPTAGYMMADSGNQISVMRRHARRYVELDLARCIDQIVIYNDVIGIGTPHFKELSRATRSWIDGVLATIDSYIDRGLSLIYRVLLTASWKLGEKPEIDALLKRTYPHVQARIQQIGEAIRARMDHQLNRLLRNSEALNTVALNSGTPLEYQERRNQQVDRHSKLTIRVIEQGLDQLKAVIDSLLRQLSELSTSFAAA